MSFLSRITRRRPEQRDWWSNGWGAVAMGLGCGPVSPVAAENLSAVLGCVELISGAIASLPASIVQDTDDGRAPAPNAAAARLLQRPNQRQSWPAFITMLVSQYLLHGNAVARIEADGRGAVSALTPIPWPWLLPQVIGVGTGRARLVFDVQHATPESALLNLPGRLLEDDALHIKARGDNGVIGRSVLSRAPGVLAAAAGVQSFSDNLWQNSATPSEVISLPSNITAEGKRRLQTFFEEKFTGSRNAGRVMFVDAESKFTPIQINPGDAEVLASRRFSVADIARLFNVPEPLLQQPAGAAVPTLTPYLAAFATTALLPIVTAIEGEFASILPPGQHLAFDMGGLTRGDWTAQASAVAVLTQSSVMTANDARAMLGLPAHPDGDDLRGGSPPSYPADATGVPSMAPKPGPGGGPLPNAGTNEGEGRG